MKYKIKSYSDTGGRDNNEDSVLTAEYDGLVLLAVADGLGGHECGEVASQMAVSELENSFGKYHEQFDIEETIQDTNEHIIQKQKESGNKMRTTVTAAVISDSMTYVANVGDSRTYLLRNGRIIFQTVGHSCAQTAVTAGKITADQIRNCDERNMLTRALGGGDSVSIDLHEEKTCAFDAALLCSDGFWEYIYESEIEETLKASSSPEQWLDHMRSIVSRRAPSGQDNNSAVVFMKNKKGCMSGLVDIINRLMGK